MTEPSEEPKAKRKCLKKAWRITKVVLGYVLPFLIVGTLPLTIWLVARNADNADSESNTSSEFELLTLCYQPISPSWVPPCNTNAQIFFPSRPHQHFIPERPQLHHLGMVIIPIDRGGDKTSARFIHNHIAVKFIIGIDITITVKIIVVEGPPILPFSQPSPSWS
jgi:hypothetical protein